MSIIKDAAELCKGQTPHSCEQQALAAEQAEDYRTAAQWWLAATYVTSGRARMQRYEEAYHDALALAKAKGGTA